jgi:1,4-alpha-glucan branching enzyme
MKKEARKKSGRGSGPSEAAPLTGDDLYLFNEGSHLRLYQKLGAHPMTFEGREGTHFAVWAPDARQVSVVGDFNGWDKTSHPLSPQGQSGIWEGFVPGVTKGEVYKYHIESRYRGYRVDKADPFAFYSEIPPRTGSVVWDTDYAWRDRGWLEKRRRRNSLEAPIAIYEVHLGSWHRVPEEEHRPLSYRELAPRLADYVSQMGFSHVEFMPVMEHPFDGSWGYQVTGYFAPTSRFGTPQDFMYLVDYLHQHDIGVILDWVPSHFPTDEHGLGFFDGTHLYEHAYPQKGFHPDWTSFIFNYGRNEVQSFLLSSALFWLDRYHADGLRVDGVASMLYLDYSRKEGEWMPNKYGGRENLEAIAFLRRFNEAVYANYPDVQTIAEESTAWPMVSRPTYVGKSSLLGKMPGDDWQKFANLRLLLGYMYSQPGKKLLFMGSELGQWQEWHHQESLDWHLLQYQRHAQIQKWVKDLNEFYRSQPALHQLDCDPAGFEWIDGSDADHSVISFIRRGSSGGPVLAVCNFTPETHFGYRLGVPQGGFWRELLNSDAADYGGSGQGNLGGLEAEPVSSHGRPYSLNLTLPPLAVLFLTSEGG